MDGWTDGQMDRWTDSLTDTPSYRDARTHLKMEKNFWPGNGSAQCYR